MPENETECNSIQPHSTNHESGNRDLDIYIIGCNVILQEDDIENYCGIDSVRKLLLQARVLAECLDDEISGIDVFGRPSVFNS